MILKDRDSLRIGFWTLLFVSIFAWAPATYPGYWQGLDGFLPIFNASSTSAISNIGVEPDLWRGVGSGAYLLVRPLVLLGLSATAAVRINFILAIILGGLGMYTWLRPNLGDKGAGLAGILYMFMPPLLSTIYIRGSLSDALIMALFPVLMAGVQTYSDERSPSAVGVIVLSQLWMWRIQPGLALIVTLFALLYILVVEWPLLANREPWLLLTLLISGAAGVTSLIPLWDVRAEPAVQFGEHFVYLFQLFGTRWEALPSIPGWQDGYPFQLGFAIYGFGAFALWSWSRFRKRTSATNRFIWFMLISGALLVFASLNPSAPIWQLIQADQLLTYPWQILLIAALPLSALAGCLVPLSPGFQNRVYWAGLVLLVLLSSHGFLTTDFTQFQPVERRPAALFGPNQELLLLDATLIRTEDNQARLDVVWQALQPMDFDYNIFFQALVEQEGAVTVVAQADSPPVQGERPATTWAVGEVIADSYQIDISLHPDPNELTYVFGFYNWENGNRLPAQDGVTGTQDNKLVLYEE